MVSSIHTAAMRMTAATTISSITSDAITTNQAIQSLSCSEEVLPQTRDEEEHQQQPTNTTSQFQELVPKPSVDQCNPLQRRPLHAHIHSQDFQCHDGIVLARQLRQFYYVINSMINRMNLSKLLPKRL
jgi:hypothetical protein